MKFYQEIAANDQVMLAPGITFIKNEALNHDKSWCSRCGDATGTFNCSTLGLEALQRAHFCSACHAVKFKPIQFAKGALDALDVRVHMVDGAVIYPDSKHLPGRPKRVEHLACTDNRDEEMCLIGLEYSNDMTCNASFECPSCKWERLFQFPNTPDEVPTLKGDPLDFETICSGSLIM